MYVGFWHPEKPARGKFDEQETQHAKLEKLFEWAKVATNRMGEGRHKSHGRRSPQIAWAKVAMNH